LWLRLSKNEIRTSQPGSLPLASFDGLAKL